MRGQRVITQAGIRAVMPRPNFGYQHRITVLACIFAHGVSVSPAVVFRGERQPHLNSGTDSGRVTDVVQKPWRAYWRKGIASVDTRIFEQWIEAFKPVARQHVSNETWLVLFYDAFRAHMTARVIGILANSRIAVMVLPAHTSDRLQPLDVSVFGPFKHRTNQAVNDRLRSFVVASRSGLRFSSLDIWRCIQSGYRLSFSKENIESGFKKSGIWPLDFTVVCANGIRKSHTNRSLVSPTSSNADVCRYFLEFKRHGPPALVVQSGFICTQTGIELTRDDVLRELHFLEVERAKKRRDKLELEGQKETELFERRAQKKNKDARPSKCPRPLIDANDTGFNSAFRVLYMREGRLLVTMLLNVAMLC